MKRWRPRVACCLLHPCVKTCTACWMNACCECKEQNGHERRIKLKGCEKDQHRHQDDAAGSSIWLSLLPVQPTAFHNIRTDATVGFSAETSNAVTPSNLFFSFCFTTYSDQSIMPRFHTPLYSYELILHVCLCLIVAYSARVTGLNRLRLLLWVVFSYCQ